MTSLFRLSHNRVAVQERGRVVCTWDPELDQRKFMMWCDAISSGDFTRAWEINDRESKHWPSAYQYWDRRSLKDRCVCVTSHHGLGDAVQMLQYAELLSRVSRRVVFRVPEALLPLRDHFDGSLQMVGLDDASYAQAPWVQVEMMELPYVFRTDSRDLPLRRTYLDSSQKLKRKFESRVPNQRRHCNIGIASQGGAWDRERWVPFNALDSLLVDSGFNFVFLQGFPPSTSEAVRDREQVLCGDIEELAGVIANLDLVISIDTLSAHLAGALGVPCWLLLKKDADWRWLTNKDRSVWYPETQVFRQCRSGSWAEPVSAIQRELPRRI